MGRVSEPTQAQWRTAFLIPCRQWNWYLITEFIQRGGKEGGNLALFMHTHQKELYENTPDNGTNNERRNMLCDVATTLGSYFYPYTYVYITYICSYNFVKSIIIIHKPVLWAPIQASQRIERSVISALILYYFNYFPLYPLYLLQALFLEPRFNYRSW